ncbi:B-cell receptor-associated protein 31 isoform X1 [Numida meleagris]|uniref:B-cell receptor-associated protein 31 isoform X1 n=1 Tax=Numida meleagris TaxID=8996 RepID=UPI000B3DC0E8|nr:B-cell receptor-associated protein 31 isoform X1 [Numida meleagris]XP_021239107.1 B-cell receptor-associated protein 31 isoform X1 [Numida meleagris]
MSLQWTVVATFLYAEVFLVLLLCVPFVSPTRWQKIFKSRLVGLAVAYGNTAFVVLIVILVLLLLDAYRETRKYGASERAALPTTPGALEHFHMRLFRAQRNLYLAGFALLLSFLLRRLVTLISQQALLGASSQAFRKQAEGASQAARRYMEDNEALRKQLQEAGEDTAPPSRAENESLKAKVEKLKEELAASKRTLEKAENEVQAMRRQAEGLTREYDRLLEQHARLQAAHDGPRDKKEE